MLMMWSAAWGIMVLIVITATERLYLPKLWERSQADALKSPIVYDKGRKCKFNIYVIILVCMCFGALCGYMAALHAVSGIGLLKMTITYAVLTCVFITDIECMLIPNMCSVVLLAGRILLFLAELVMQNESALEWLCNSFVAMIVSFVFLIAVSKAAKGGIGAGDIKIISSIGFMCGISAVFATLVLAFLLCAVVSAFLLAAKKRKMKDSLPLGPFIWGGNGIAILLSLI